MECDRSITTDDSKPVFQQSMSRGCTKVLFWSSPYACHSERTSCTHTAGDKFFDFTPLQANPGEMAWKTQHSGDEYYVNLCGSIPDFTGCDPETAVCLHTSKGGWLNIGMTSTQEIIGTTDDHIQIKFSGRHKCRDATSHVTIDMSCGLSGLTLDRNDENLCTYEFLWSTPYACHVEDTIQKWTKCEDQLKSNEYDGLVFLPNKLKSSDGMSVVEGDSAQRTFHVSLCGGNSHCTHGSSVCYTNSSGLTTNVATSSLQTIMTQGTSMWIQMNSTDGFSHAIVNVECVDDSADVSRAETMEFVKVTTSTAGSERHTFYHFNMWTKKGCSFSTPTTAPYTPTNHHKSTDNGGDHSGGSGSSGSGGTSSTVVALLVTLVVLMVAAIFLGFIFYKKERRDRFINLFKNKSSEPVKYEKLPMTLTEETSLLEEGSSGSEHGEGSGEEEGEGGGGEGGKRRPRD
ncbi:Cation-independent mannose-6-phosphate receptor, partial [Geodia barretti]